MKKTNNLWQLILFLPIAIFFIFSCFNVIDVQIFDGTKYISHEMSLYKSLDFSPLNHNGYTIFIYLLIISISFLLLLVLTSYFTKKDLWLPIKILSFCPLLFLSFLTVYLSSFGWVLYAILFIAAFLPMAIEFIMTFKVKLFQNVTITIIFTINSTFLILLSFLFRIPSL